MDSNWRNNTDKQKLINKQNEKLLWLNLKQQLMKSKQVTTELKYKKKTTTRTTKLKEKRKQ